MSWFNANPDIAVMEEAEKVFESQFINRVKYDLKMHEKFLVDLFNKKLKRAFSDGFIECKYSIEAHEEPPLSFSSVSIYISWDLFLNQKKELYKENELVEHAKLLGESLSYA